MSTHQAPSKDGSNLHERPNNMPIFYNSFTRATAPWFSWQRGICADYEYEWSLCASRVSFKDAATVCKKLHDDFIECAYKVKSKERYLAMQKERQDQKKPYISAPEPDSIRVFNCE